MKPRQPNSRLHTLTLACLALGTALAGAACAGEESVQLTYADTLCTDPWDRGDRTEDVLVDIRTTLEDAGVTVLSLTEDASNAGGPVCLACHCKSGIVYLLETEERDADKAVALGFVAVR